MRKLRIALVLCGTWLLASACRTTASMQSVDPSYQRDFGAIERALTDGDDVRARELVDSVLARKPKGATLARARNLEGALVEREIGRYGAQFEALQAALEDRDQELAQRVLDRLLASQPNGAARARAEAFARVIEGRKLVSAMTLRLEARETDEPGTYQLYLDVSHSLDDTLRLRCGGSAINYLAVGVDPYGIEQRAARNMLVDALDDLEIEAGKPREVLLGTFSLAVRGLMASRGRWELHSMAGSIERGGATFPAMNVDAAPLEVVRLDKGLATEPVTPEELVGFVNEAIKRQALRATPALLARAVRVESSRRFEALDALTPTALQLGNPDLACLLPVLRWLSGERELGADARVWRSWLEARVASRSQIDSRTESTLAASGR